MGILGVLAPVMIGHSRHHATADELVLNYDRRTRLEQNLAPAMATAHRSCLLTTINLFSHAPQTSPDPESSSPPQKRGLYAWLPELRHPLLANYLTMHESSKMLWLAQGNGKT